MVLTISQSFRLGILTMLFFEKTNGEEFEVSLFCLNESYIGAPHTVFDRVFVIHSHISRVTILQNALLQIDILYSSKEIQLSTRTNKNLENLVHQELNRKLTK